LRSRSAPASVANGNSERLAAPMEPARWRNLRRRPLAHAGSALVRHEVRFALDSRLEGAGFEPPVPLGKATVRDRFASF
jgi:hypothetical protein